MEIGMQSVVCPKENDPQKRTKKEGKHIRTKHIGIFIKTS